MKDDRGKSIDQVRKLWQDVRKHITTDNIKLIQAIDTFEKYIY